jgi:gliding motility-associated-like protein
MKMEKTIITAVLLIFTCYGLKAQDITEVNLVSTPVTCGGVSDGSIFIEVSGGIGNLNYTLFLSGSIIASSGFIPDRSYTFTNLPKSADYLLFVGDAVGSTSNYFSEPDVDGPDPVNITGATVTDINCAYLNDGTITITATGEDGNLVYDLSGPRNESNSTGFFSGLPTGTYAVSVSHTTCPSSDMVSGLFIDIPPPLTINLDNIIDVTCYEGSNGAIDITPGGGTPSGAGTGYSYSWSGPAGFSSTDEDISGLQAGDYQVTITDGNGCNETLGPITVDQPAQITLPSVSSTNVSCNGGNDGTATITVAGGSPPYAFSWSGQLTGSAGSDQNPSNLVADVYTLTVTDNAGCVRVFSGLITISQPDPIGITVENSVHVSCFGGSDGSADITVIGGTAPYLFNWTGSGGYSSSGEDPAGMEAGTYSLTVTDVNGCVKNFPDIVTITQPDDIAAVLNGSTDVTCFGGADGTALVTVSNGTPGYSYLWTGIFTGHTSTEEDPVNLIADTYILQITDANACVKFFNNIVTINQPADITTPITTTDVNCNGESTGEISITPSGGTAPYTFSWSGPNGFSSTNEDISGLEAGTYNLTITDAQGCIKEFNNIIINENTSITASFVITHLSCNGAGDGAINVSVAGGTPPYSYAWSGDNGYTNNLDEDISGLDAANYTLTVTDALGCAEVFAAQSVIEPAPLTASFIPSNATCYGSNDGFINVTVTGGTTGYNYLWSGPGGFSSTQEDISGLEPGSYSLVITDANSCFISYPDVVTVSEPTEISISATSTEISCNGAADGTISITPSGGTPGYSYNWTGPGGFSSTNQNIASLDAGTYNLTITDNNSCIKLFSNVATLSEPDPIVVTFVSQTNLDCFGDNNGSINIDVSGGSPPYIFSWTNIMGTVVSTNEDPTGLSAGTFSLRITDNSGCEAYFPDAVVRTEPEELSTTLAKTDVVCAGQANGTITVTATGGTPPYEHSRFLAGPYSTNNTFTGLSNGTYRIYTRDANSCMTSRTITINKPEAINYEYGINGQNVCHGDANVTITISNVTGGVAPYEFSIDGGTTYQSSSLFPNLPGGSYPVVVRDANLCEQAIAPLTILEPDPVIITYYDYQDVTSCYDSEEGWIIIMGDGGTGNIRYALNNGPSVDLGEFNNLPGGSYTISLIDEQLCQTDTVVEILRPDQLIFDRAAVIDVTGCPGDNNGEIDAEASGGTGLLEYSIDGFNWQVTGLFANLIAGNYTLLVRDNNGCIEDTTVSVTEPLPVSILSETSIPASCFGTSTGSVTVEPGGGTAPYTFSISPPVSPPQSSGTFSGLPAGDYVISITDAEGCGPVPSNNLTITEPPELITDSVKIDHITCNGAGDGKIAVYLSGGTSPYEYSVDNEVTWETGFSFTGLGPDTYEVYARDANGCSVHVGTYTLNEPPVLNATAVVTDVSPCFGGTNGAITVTASGGWSAYEYSIDGLNYQLSGDFTGLIAGTYTIVVRDTGNCSVSNEETVSEPEQVMAVITKTDYVDETLGTISISDATGGTPPYEYSIDGISGTFTSTTSYTDLTAGFYNVVVRDASGCTYEETIRIFDIIPLDMVMNSTNVSCFGRNDGTIEFFPQDGTGTVYYSIDNGTTYTTEPLFGNLKGDSTYMLRAYDDESKQYYGSIYIAEPAELFAFKSITPANCNAFSETGSANITVTGGTGIKTFNWSDGSTQEDLLNVVSGEYFVTITDEAGCELTESVYIPSLVTVNVDAGEDTTVCQGSTINIEGSHGPDYNMRWEPETYLSNQDVYNPVASNFMEPVTYTYTLTETTSGFGCYNIDTLHIDVLPVYGLEITADTFGLKGQSIQLEVLNSGNYESYLWTPETGLSMVSVPDPLATLQNSIWYWLQATNDYGCLETDSVFIEVIEDIKVYNAFSPNGDQINDFFDIENAYKFPDILVEVYNRWGARVFSSAGYSDDKRWDGTMNGKDVPTGTYYYVVIPYPEAKPITGNVTIIR